MTEEVEARPDGDIWFYHGPLDELTLTGDRFMVFSPATPTPPPSPWDSPRPAASAWSRSASEPYIAKPAL